MVSSKFKKYAEERGYELRVSLKKEPWFTELFDQDGFPVCNSTSMTDLLTMIIKKLSPDKKKYKKLRLSPQPILDFNKKDQFFWENALYLKEHGVPSLEDSRWIRCRGPTKEQNPPSDVEVYKPTDVVYLDPLDIIDHLNAGFPVFANLCATEHFFNWKPRHGPYTSGVKKKEDNYNHSVIVFGYDVRNEKNQKFFVKNSAGNGCGKDGCIEVECHEIVDGVSFVKLEDEDKEGEGENEEEGDMAANMEVEAEDEGGNKDEENMAASKEAEAEVTDPETATEDEEEEKTVKALPVIRRKRGKRRRVK